MKKILFSLLLASSTMCSFAQVSILSGNYFIQSSANNLALVGTDRGNQIKTTKASNNGAVYSFVSTFDGNNSYYIRNTYMGNNLDANGGATSNGTNIITWEPNGNNNQKWQFFPNGSNYEIRGVASGKDMAISNASTTPGAGIVLFSPNTGWNQLFKLQYITENIADGNYTIAGLYNGLNLAPASTSIGAIIQVSGSAAQQFSIRNVGNGTNTYTIKNIASGYYVEAYQGSTQNGTLIDQWSGTGAGNNARWQFILQPGTNSYEIRNVASNSDISILNNDNTPGTALILNNPTPRVNTLFKLNPYTFSFSSQPSSKSIEVGTETNFYAIPSTPVSSYRWQYSSDGSNWVDAPDTYISAYGSLSGSNTSQINLVTTSTYWNGWKWRVKVVSTLDNLTYYSAAANLALTTPVVTCTTQPGNVTTPIGTTATVTAGFIRTSTGAAISGDSVHWRYSTDGYSWNWVQGPTQPYDNVTIPGGTLSGGNSNSLYVAITGSSNWGVSGLLVQAVAKVSNGNYYSRPATVKYKNASISKVTDASLSTGFNVTTVLAPNLLYPNPAYNSITVTNLIGNSTINLVDMLGNILSSTKTSSKTAILKLDNYAAGNYVVTIRSLENGYVTTSSLPFIKK